MLTTFTIGVFLSLLPAQNREKQDSLLPSMQEPGTKVTVGPGVISVPDGLVMLVRKGGQVGALRFSGIKPDHEKFRGAAEYESVFQGDGSGSFSKANVIARKGKVHEKPLVGIGRLAFQTGRTTLHIGPFKFYYNFPTWVHMWPAGKEDGDYGFEFSVVRASDFRSIDSGNPALKWYRFDNNKRIEITIP